MYCWVTTPRPPASVAVEKASMNLAATPAASVTLSIASSNCQGEPLLKYRKFES